MLDLKQENMITTEEKLLYEILQELKKLNGKSVTKEIKQNEKINKQELACKYCNGVHENKGQFLACARKNKKKEG